MSALPVPATRGAGIPFAVPTTPVVNPSLPSFGPYVQAADSKGRHTVVNDDFHLFGTHGHGWGYKYPHGGYAGYLSEYGVPPGATVMAGEQYAPQAPVLVGRPHGAGYYYPQGSHGYGEGFGHAYGHGVSYPYGHGHTWPYYYPQNYTHGGIFGAGPQPYPHHHTSYHSGQRHSRYQGGELIGN